MMDYLVFVGLVLLVSLFTMVVVYWVHRRGITFSMTPVGVSCAAAVAIAGFVIGKQGFTLLSIGIAAICLLPPCLLAYRYLLLNFIKPIQQMDSALDAVAEGDFGCQVPEINNKDELGKMSRSFGKMVANLRNIAEVASQISDGNLAADWSIRSEKDKLGKTLSLMVNSMRDRINQILESADRMSKQSNKIAAGTNQVGNVTSQISTTIQQISEGISHQTNNISRTAASVDQMNELMSNVARGTQEESNMAQQASGITSQMMLKISSVNENAQACAKGSANAAQTARAGAATIESSMQSMQNIKTSANKVNEKVRLMGSRSEQIGSIVATIEEIASQTNLLALNAAIEAARAGEAGKGFAVVADEVRKLAEKSAGATKEITNLVKGIQQTVSEAVSAIGEEAIDIDNGVIHSNEAVQALKNILTSIETINKQVDLIASAAQDMNISSNQLVSSMDTVLAVSENNNTSTQKMVAYSADVSQAFENIASISEENSASILELRSASGEMNAQAIDVTNASQDLLNIAVDLQQKTLKLTTKKVSGKVSRGAALLGRINFVKERYGNAAWEKILAQMDSNIQSIISRGIEPSGEYPPEVLGILTNTIRNKLANGSDDILREMTAFRAKFDVLPGGDLSQHFRMGDPGFTIRRMDLCLRHNWGEGVIVRNFELGPNHIRQEVDMGGKQPRERCTYNHVGWMEGVIITAGGIPHIKKTKCMHDGAPYCEYDISWEMAR